MALLQAVRLPQLYKGFAKVDPVGPSSGRYIETVNYYCEQCKTHFGISHVWRGLMNGGYRQNKIICPSCGVQWDNHGKRQDYHKVYQVDDTLMPHSMDLYLHEDDDAVKVFAVTHVTPFNSAYQKRLTTTETITYNIRERKTVYSYRAAGTRKLIRVEIGNPFATDFMKQSMLGHITFYNMTKDHLPEVDSLLRTLRQVICRKYKETHGYRLKGLYTSCGDHLGHVLVPLFYMAYRLLLPDVRAVPDWVKYKGVRVFADVREAMEPLFAEAGMKLLRQPGKGTVDVIIDMLNIPKTALSRKTVATDPFSAGLLKFGYDITHHMDQAVQVLNCMNWAIEHGHQLNPLKNMLATWLRRYPVGEVVGFIQAHTTDYIARDTHRMEQKLSPANRALYKAVRLKDAHEWLLRKLQEQKEQDYDLGIPEHIKRRFTMQLDGCSFVTPRMADELRKGGKEFHNCVGTYCDRVLQQECTIVFMTDDKGKLLACIEVSQGKVVQAKLKYNKPVALDRQVNDEILAWAVKVGLKIDTPDIVTAKKSDAETKSA